MPASLPAPCHLDADRLGAIVAESEADDGFPCELDGEYDIHDGPFGSADYDAWLVEHHPWPPADAA